MDYINNDWQPVLAEEFNKPYFKDLMTFIDDEYKNKTIYPLRQDIFSAFKYTPFHKVSVLILGQDPYYNEGQAHGLAFSALPGQPIPKSLVNIYKELQSDLGLKIPNNAYLKKWADQGVFLMNTVLTVRAKEPNSHRKKGWEIFTDQVIKEINSIDRPVVIILWGKPAAAKEKLLNNSEHLVIKTSHPSPLSAYRGFFGSHCFSRCNAYLESKGRSIIDWQIEDLADPYQQVSLL